jgi:hypothetical protein
MNQLIILAGLIRLLHISLVLYVGTNWYFLFSTNVYPSQVLPISIALYLTVLASLKLHWYLNDDTCALTLLECVITGKPKSNSFIHSIVSPVYKIKDENLAKISGTMVNVLFIYTLFRLAVN